MKLISVLLSCGFFVMDYKQKYKVHSNLLQNCIIHALEVQFESKTLEEH